MAFSLCKATLCAQHRIEYGDKNHMEYDSLLNRFVIKSKNPNGYWNIFLHNKLVEESSIIDSEKNGIDILYDFKGRRLAVRNYIHDKLNGYVWKYDSAGFVLYQYYYLNNSMKNVESFDSAGNILWINHSYDGYEIDQTFYANCQKKSELLIVDSLKSSFTLPKKYSINISDMSITVPYPFDNNYDSLGLNLDDITEEGGMYCIVDEGKVYTSIEFHNFSRAWYENGKIKETIGKTDSLGTEKIYYYENGSIWKMGRYIKNLRNGKWYFYRKDGSLENVIDYHLGRKELKTSKKK